ncbi:Crp/Fnr family transcriptional regulator [uncultured Croceitalea sp.]|uniref:Crp/Fnr family transcriptional regulator n=1 Tax=uncultured Croceitalea sp. TaxID=1798908 RepID=UPI0033055C38
MSGPLQSLKAFIENYVVLKQEDWSIICSNFHLKTFKKGEHILTKGEVCSQLYFLESGLLHFYIWKDGEPKTKFFTIAPYMFTSQRSFNIQTPALENIQAIEDSTVWKVSFTDHQNLLKLPVWNSFGQKITQEVQFFTENILEDVQNETAEKRYQLILKNRPELLQRVPLKFLASYLGITQQSLSRIRKNIH